MSAIPQAMTAGTMRLANNESVSGRDLTQLVARMQTSLREPFDKDVVSALSRLSSALMKDRTAPPAFTALGYWLRPAALESYRREFMDALPQKAIAAPRGITFHLPPTNVDTIFVYSWALSLLVGNANLVRLPSSANPALDRLLPMIADALAGSGVEGGNLFATWPQDGPMTARWSELCDTRVIWGGDAKVSMINPMPLRPGAVSIPFPDRFSYSVIGLDAFHALDGQGRDALADKVFNDIFLFDQMACSSSRIVFWLGGEASYRDSAADFAARVSAAAQRRGYDLATSTRVAKFLHAHQEAIDGDLVAADALEPVMTSLYAASPAAASRRAQGGGVLVHARIDSLSDIAAHVEKRDQTLTHFGVGMDDLRAFARSLKGQGVERIVPVGDALQFDRIWDGFDLLRSFSKLLVVR
jgi:hypothetical protein